VDLNAVFKVRGGAADGDNLSLPLEREGEYFCRLVAPYDCR